MKIMAILSFETSGIDDPAMRPNNPDDVSPVSNGVGTANWGFGV